MLRIILILGLLVLVPALIAFWQLRDRSVGPSGISGAHSSSSKPVGTTTLSHGNLPSAPLPPGGPHGLDGDQGRKE